MTREEEYGMDYGYRSLLAWVLQFVWCSWRGHKMRKDFRGNMRCTLCLYSEVDK